MTNTTCPGPMIPPLIFNPTSGHNRHPVTTGYVSPSMSMNMVLGPAFLASASAPAAPAPTAAPVPILPSTAPRPPQVQPTTPNPFSGVANITTMPAQALSQRAPVAQVPSQAHAQPQPGPAFIPPYSGSRHHGRSGDRHHRHHHHHHHPHHHSRHSPRSHDHAHAHERTRSYSPVGRGHQDHARRDRVVNDDKAEEDDDVNPPIPPDYVPASPGPEHKSHLGARARAGIAGIGHRAAGAVGHGERHGGKDRAREDNQMDRKHGHGHGHERGRVHSHDYAKDLVSALHRLSVGGGGGSGSGGYAGGGGTVGGGGQIHSSSPRPTFTRHRSRSIDDRDLQTSRARYANTGGVGAGGYQYRYQQQQQPVFYQQQPLPYQTQQGATLLAPAQQQQPQQPAFLQQSSLPYQTQQGATTTAPAGPAMGSGGGQPTMIYPSASPTQPIFVPTHHGTGRSGSGGQWMSLAPTSAPAASTSRPRAASTGARVPSSPSFFARFFSGFGRRHGHGQVNGSASTRAVQPLPPPPPAHSPVQYVHRYMPHSHHHHNHHQRRGHDDRKLAKRRRKSF